MEKYQTIDEYVAAEMSDKIKRKAKSPLLGLLILAVGIFLLVMLRTQKMDDTLMMLCLTVGIIALGVGIIITAMCLTGAISHYVYTPTHSRMKQRKCYLSLDDYKLCIEAIGCNNLTTLGALHVVVEAVAAEEHSHTEKQQQGRHAETAARLAGQYAGKEECGENQQEQLYLHSDWMWVTSVPVRRRTGVSGSKWPLLSRMACSRATAWSWL